MRRRPGSVTSCLIAVSLLVGWISAARAGDAGPEKAGGAIAVTLRGDRTGTAINPFIYGQFIEHLGRCIYGGIWAEMLEDRKFYFPITAEYNPYRSLTDTPFPVVGASPWQIIGPAEAVTMVEEEPFVGEHTPRIKRRRRHPPAGPRRWSRARATSATSGLRRPKSDGIGGRRPGLGR